jgi:hypothetical protein
MFIRKFGGKVFCRPEAGKRNIWALIIGTALWTASAPNSTALAGEPGRSSSAVESTANTSSAPSNSVQTVDLQEVVDEALRALENSTVRRVLLVFDIDNTVLTMPQFLGGDRWYNHQAALLAENRNPDFASFDELFEAQGALFSVAGMRLTQPNGASLIAEAEAAGIDVAFLTARGPSFFDATRRELSRNDINFTPVHTCSAILCDLDGILEDADIRRALQAFGAVPDSETYRRVALRGGVMMVAGQDKGEMLRVLLATLVHTQYDHIVFVDDAEKNIEAVASNGPPIPTSIFHYTRIDTDVTPSEIRQARGEWQTLLASICTAMRSRLCDSPSAMSSTQ